MAGLSVGILLLFIVGYTNWYGNVKANSIKWIANKVFINNPSGEKRANGMFMVMTSILLSLGGISVLLSLLFLGFI